MSKSERSHDLQIVERRQAGQEEVFAARHLDVGLDRHDAAQGIFRDGEGAAGADQRIGLVERHGLVERELDWVIKYRIIERYRAKHGLELGDPRVARLDLAYHDISRTEGLYNLLAARGLVDRVTTDLEVFEATAVPPQTTRAKLRGDFVRAAQEARRDYTVDWVHLKLNDQAQRTVLCKDPFRAVDDRVDRLIESM